MVRKRLVFFSLLHVLKKRHHWFHFFPLDVTTFFGQTSIFSIFLSLTMHKLFSESTGKNLDPLTSQMNVFKGLKVNK